MGAIFSHSGVGMVRGIDVMDGGDLVVTGFQEGVDRGLSLFLMSQKGSLGA